MTSTVSPRLGIAFVPTLPPERLRAVALAVDSAGLDEFWVWEDCFKESGIATATAALAWTERITVGLGLMPAPLRNVALVAMEIATLDRIFGARFIAGVGHGVQDWMGQVGARVESPMTLLTEHVTALRRLLAGELVSLQGRYLQLDSVKLDWPPVVPPQLMLGGAGPRSLELAGRLGDGTLLSGVLTDDEIRFACDLVTSTRQSAQQSAKHQILATVIAATGPGAAGRVDDEVRRWGKQPGLGIGLAGDAKHLAEGLLRLAGLGVTSVCIQPTSDEPDLEGLIQFLGQQVRPLLA